jgi:hypothetical protein
MVLISTEITILETLEEENKWEDLERKRQMNSCRVGCEHRNTPKIYRCQCWTRGMNVKMWFCSIPVSDSFVIPWSLFSVRAFDIRSSIQSLQARDGIEPGNRQQALLAETFQAPQKCSSHIFRDPITAELNTATINKLLSRDCSFWHTFVNTLS